MMVEWLFLAVPCGCLQFVIVVFPDHTHLLFLERSVKIPLSENERGIRVMSCRQAFLKGHVYMILTFDSNVISVL